MRLVHSRFPAKEGMKKNEKSRRIRERVRLTIPERVCGRDSLDYEWTEMSRVVDVTPYGARLGLSRPAWPRFAVGMFGRTAFHVCTFGSSVVNDRSKESIKRGFIMTIGA